jgi:hypothetical protein
MEGSSYINVSMEYLEKLASQDSEVLAKKVYHTFSKFSSLVIEAKQENFKRGWASLIKDRHGPIFSSKEARIIEDAFQGCIKPLFNKPHPLPRPDNKNIDKIFNTIQRHYAEIDMQLNELSREFGPFRFFYEKKYEFTISFPVPLPQAPHYTIIKIPEKSKGISIFIDLILESIRSILSTSNSNEIKSSISVVLLALVDILKGNWKQGLLDLATCYKDSPLVIELIGKVLFILLDVFTSELSGVMHQSNKTILVAFCLWGFSFSLESERLSVRNQLDEMNHGEESSIHKESELPVGLRKDDIKTLHSIKNLAELQDTPLYKIPIMHLILELMHSPK